MNQQYGTVPHSKLSSFDPDLSLTYYKAFNSNLQCKGFQFKIGKEFEAEGELKLCFNGFHFCADFEKLKIYYPVGSRVCLVKPIGKVQGSVNDKLCCLKIKIERELTGKELIALDRDMHFSFGSFLAVNSWEKQKEFLDPLIQKRIQSRKIKKLEKWNWKYNIIPNKILNMIYNNHGDQYSPAIVNFFLNVFRTYKEHLGDNESNQILPIIANSLDKDEIQDFIKIDSKGHTTKQLYGIGVINKNEYIQKMHTFKTINGKQLWIQALIECKLPLNQIYAKVLKEDDNGKQLLYLYQNLGQFKENETIERDRIVKAIVRKTKSAKLLYQLLNYRVPSSEFLIKKIIERDKTGYYILNIFKNKRAISPLKAINSLLKIEDPKAIKNISEILFMCPYLNTNNIINKIIAEKSQDHLILIWRHLTEEHKQKIFEQIFIDPNENIIRVFIQKSFQELDSEQKNRLIDFVIKIDKDGELCANIIDYALDERLQLVLDKLIELDQKGKYLIKVSNSWHVSQKTRKTVVKQLVKIGAPPKVLLRASQYPDIDSDEIAEEIIKRGKNTTIQRYLKTTNLDTNKIREYKQKFEI